VHCRVHCLAHDTAARTFKKRHSVINVPLKILPFVTTTLLAPYANGDSSPGWVTMFALANTCIIGALAIAGDTMGYAKASVAHRDANLAYSQLYRDIMHFMARSHSDSEVEGYVTLLEYRINDLDEHSPTFPQYMFLRAQAEIDGSTQVDQADRLCELYLEAYRSPTREPPPMQQYYDNRNTNGCDHYYRQNATIHGCQSFGNDIEKIAGTPPTPVGPGLRHVAMHAAEHGENARGQIEHWVDENGDFILDVH
jgi:hypothetical protein